MEEMKELTSTSFGYLIGFLLPGMFGLYSLTYWFTQVGTLLQPILKPDTTVGSSILFLVIAIGMGLCISAARFFIFEKGLYKKRCLSLEMYEGFDSEKLSLHKAFAEEHYRYHQFYGGCAIALLIMFVGWIHHLDTFNCHHLYMLIGFIMFGILLERSASDSFGKYVDKCTAIGAKSEPLVSAERQNT